MHAAFPPPCARRIQRFDEPFLHGWIDDALPRPIYDALAAQFIDPGLHPAGERLGRGKRRVRFRTPPVPGMVQERSEPWAAALRALGDAQYVADWLGWLRASAFLEQQPEGPYRSLLAARLSVDARLLHWQCEFSALECGDLLPPHSDSTDKLLSCILYFTPPHWEPSWGGGTEFYAPADPRHRHNWGNVLLSPAQMCVRDVCEYRANRLCFFAKGHGAWHGVAPLAVPPGVQRRSFGFSLAIPPELGANAPWAAHEAEIARLEAQVFGTA